MTATVTIPQVVITTGLKEEGFYLKTIMPAKLITQDDYYPQTTLTLDYSSKWTYSEKALMEIRDMISQHLNVIEDYKKVEADRLKESK